ncbi:DUF1801 domain-containing protein [Ideonella sp. 4Y16]|uniref:DUF1801 domain-containing protein n=1 Tax=Ideonella alba TaxID=2824118 RepID=UPI001B37BCC0|nr:DUF1801 domain-containing protein [Ideonella alba]MBQ0945143.1 DUF1801 domain-containing protein [Ideonella alba]
MPHRKKPMPTSKSSRQVAAPMGGVDAFLASLAHPHKEGIELLRQAILAVDSRITEDVKWNAPSFALADHFATFKLHPPATLQLVLHTGARRQASPRRFALSGAEPFIKWAAPDRCVITLANTASAREHTALVANLVRQWLEQL